MAHSTLIMGQTGQGKTRSLFTLNPAKTVLIQTIRKPLPWKGSATAYSEGKNKFATDDMARIEEIIKRASESKTRSVTSIVIDDWQYALANQYMRRAFENGFNKFTEMGTAYWSVIMAANNVPREDLCIFFLSHSEITDAGVEKVKTIGKLLDEKITVEGLFTVVLKATRQDDRYGFATQTNGHDNVKSPEGMFAERLIENDLEFVRKSITEYFQGEQA